MNILVLFLYPGCFIILYVENNISCKSVISLCFMFDTQVAWITYVQPGFE